MDLVEGTAGAEAGSATIAAGDRFIEPISGFKPDRSSPQ